MLVVLGWLGLVKLGLGGVGQAAKPFKDRLKDSLLTSFLFLLQRLKVF